MATDEIITVKVQHDFVTKVLGNNRRKSDFREFTAFLNEVRSLFSDALPPNLIPQLWYKTGSFRNIIFSDESLCYAIERSMNDNIVINVGRILADENNSPGWKTKAQESAAEANTLKEEVRRLRSYIHEHNQVCPIFKDAQTFLPAYQSGEVPSTAVDVVDLVFNQPSTSEFAGAGRAIKIKTEGDKPLPQEG